MPEMPEWQPPRRSAGWGPKPPRTRHTVRNTMLGILAAFVVLTIISVAAGGTSTTHDTAPAAHAHSTDAATPSTAPPTSDPSTMTAVAPSTKAPTQAPPTSTRPATHDGVVYRCTGSAPSGVDITYGPSGSSLQARGLPFTAHSAVDESAEYYSISAQLQGGGEVTCTVTVTDDGQSAHSSGTAQGGYNLATPEVCSDFDEGWEPCG